MIRGLVTILAAASIAWPPSPPQAAPQPVTDTYFGHSVIDRYRYLEKLDSPQVQQFFRQQADYTNAVLDKLGAGRERIRADITKLFDAGTAVYSISEVPGHIFY